MYVWHKVGCFTRTALWGRNRRNLKLIRISIVLNLGWIGMLLNLGIISYFRLIDIIDQNYLDILNAGILVSIILSALLIIWCYEFKYLLVEQEKLKNKLLIAAGCIA